MWSIRAHIQLCKRKKYVKYPYIYSPVCPCVYVCICLLCNEAQRHTSSLESSWGLEIPQSCERTLPGFVSRVIETGVFVLNVPKAFQSSIVFV